jgi:hypothetical protein
MATHLQLACLRDGVGNMEHIRERLSCCSTKGEVYSLQRQFMHEKDRCQHIRYNLQEMLTMPDDGEIQSLAANVVAEIQTNTDMLLRFSWCETPKLD